jgi:hypothetical protein
MEKKLTVKENLAMAALAALIVGSLVGVVVVLDWLEIDFKWFRFVGWTGFVFGILAYACAHDIKKIRTITTLVALLTVHMAVWVPHLRSGGGLPRLFVVIAVLEVGIGALTLTFVGGVRARLPSHRKYRPGGQFWKEKIKPRPEVKR